MPNRIWIELEVDKDNDVNERRAELMTNMLRRLGDNISKVWWWKDKGVYCLTKDEAGGFLEMADKGHWFNLDYMGLPVGPQPLEKILGPDENVGSIAP